jgi:16S rRNA (cytosine1402-N4)-methyltransferase
MPIAPAVCHAGVVTDEPVPATPPPDAAARPKRRPRYSGKNPRRFEEKYKELNPGRYADDVAKIISSGKTPAGTHRPIMVAEILAALAPKPGEFAVDCTLGYGGHTTELLRAIQPGGKLLALDMDPIELPKTESRLRALGFGPEVLQTRLSNFAGIAKAINAVQWPGTDLVLADLGVSSMQIDDPSRGFTFKAEGPLDLRLNPQRGQSAAELLARIDVARLGALLVKIADEPYAELLARAMMSAQQRTPLTTTVRLAQVIRDALATLPKQIREAEGDSPVRRVFQALRIAVNDEFGALDSLLRQLPGALKPGGRVAILTFHSGEDRRVKKAFQAGQREGMYSAINDEVGRPAAEEVRSNPRASSAKLRWAVRAVK